jgi:hypothetical protein
MCLDPLIALIFCVGFFLDRQTSDTLEGMDSRNYYNNEVFGVGHLHTFFFAALDKIHPSHHRRGTLAITFRNYTSDTNDRN